MTTSDRDQILAAAERAGAHIPPLWPLAASVAVNPFLGQAGEPLAMASARWQRAAGTTVVMPRAWFAERLAEGLIEGEDLAGAVQAAGSALTPADLRQAASLPRETVTAPATVAELAAEASGIDWPGLVRNRIGHWAAGYFDEGQALWPVRRGETAYAGWRLTALHDLTPEIAGLEGFADHVARMPMTGGEALVEAATALGLAEDALDGYFLRLLAGLGGWAQVGRYRGWQAGLEGRSDETLRDLLAIALVWEVALLDRHRAAVGGDWAAAVAAHGAPIGPSSDDVIDELLQEASERAAQRRLFATLDQQGARTGEGRPRLQAAFCIDVRSEVFRRALERIDPAIQTLGFAGFFGLGTAHRRFASDVVERRLPVLLNPGLQSVAEGTSGRARIAARAKRAWRRFKLAAVSSFAFVEAAGPIYLAKLIREALGRVTAKGTDPAPVFTPPLPTDAAIATAETILRAMSLTRDFAPLVLIAGHGANTVNNPHASALHCGACGGYSGEVNARLLAGLLNRTDVRSGLAARDILVPGDTLFVAALHDTTTDAVTLFTDDQPGGDHDAAIREAECWLAQARRLAATERALRLPRASSAGDVAARARNWAELRPEWALAGCQAFIAAPRASTAGRDLGGRAFLHDYRWQADEDFRILDLILTAPMVVASWISLQYYGSTVAPALFGAGNKLLHNVTGGLGVVEGNGGLLRGGLPLQSVSDGERLVHEPLRLSVIVAAPREAISDILARHKGVRALFDNGWLHLFALDENGSRHRYSGALRWEAERSEGERALVAA